MADGPDLDRRTAGRSPTNLPTRCRVPATPRPAMLLDISTDGCRLETRDRMSVGTTVVVTLPFWSDVEGMVMWVKGRTAGVHFHRPIPADLVETIAALPDVTLTAKVA